MSIRYYGSKKLKIKRYKSTNKQQYTVVPAVTKITKIVANKNLSVGKLICTKLRIS
jgi:hypothetical protein